MPKYHVDRSIDIDASPEKVHSVVADFGTWPEWSPWLCIEPEAEVTITDDACSVGSVYSWKGEVVGQGEIEHQQLETGRFIDQEIRFLKPFKSVSRVSFEMQANGGGTRVTWNMDGKLPWFLFWMKPMMQRFLGMDYERGLRMLKEWIETGQVLSRTTVHGVESVGPLKVIGVRTRCTMKDIGPSMEQTIGRVHEEFDRHGLPKDGEMISVYHEFNLKQQLVDYTSGYIVPSNVAVPEGMSSWSLPAGQALRVEHVGRYDHMGNAWNAAQQNARYRKLKQSKVGTFEIYRNNPAETAEADLLTEIYLPLR